MIRKAIPSAAKACARRRLTVAPLRDSWFLTAEQSFWRRESRFRSFGATARPLVASQGGHQREEEEGNGSKLKHGLVHMDLSLLEGNETGIPQMQSMSPIQQACRSDFGGNGRTSWHYLSSNHQRYVPPPSSIRASHCLSQLVATERATRVLTTWCSCYGQQSSVLPSVGDRWKDRHRPAVFFFSTNSDGSRILRDPRSSGLRARTKIPTPPSGPDQQSMKPEDVIEKINKTSKTVVLPALTSGMKAVSSFFLNLPKNILFYLMHPSEIKEWWNNMKKVIKDEIDHYWVGTKLLWADLKTARTLFRRTLRGSSLTRRERKQLLRTISDLFRLVPFSMFLIIPLMEFALPFALKIFPNLLPSTFQDSLKAEENMKRELKTRIAMAKFFQETMEDLAKEQKLSASHLKQEIEESGQEDDNIDESVVAAQEASAASFLDFMEKARSGEIIPNDVIVRYAHYFKDDLTLDNMPRMQLINMCKYMGITPYGSDSFLRFQLRHRMRSLQEDDQRILWEGIDSLTKMELREACQERGMRSTGLSKDAYKRALQQWLDLSVKRNVPTSLLIMSRTFFLREEMFEREADDGSKSIAGLADAISGLDKEVVNEVILDVATSQEKMSDPGVRKIKLEVLMKQNELIEQEQAERDEAAAKKKEQAEKERKEAEMEKLSSSLEEPSHAVLEGEKLQEHEIRTYSEPTISAAAFDASTTDEALKESKVDEDLSTDEMDAISQLVSADPVSRERADLESIKAALHEKSAEAEKEVQGTDSFEKAEQEGSAAVESAQTEADLKVAALHANVAVEEIGQAEKDSIDSSVVADGDTPPSVPEDPVVARLKKRIESMVDKIEVQLSDVQVKIGDKLHVLDKDMDGILSVEEIAEALQLVLKREITSEEAMEIAKQIDDNKDGVFTVQELIQWVETNQLVKFVEEGRDADMDRIMQQQTAAEHQEQQEEQQSTKNEQ